VLEAGTGRGILPFQIREQPHSGARLLTRARLRDAERRARRADARRAVRVTTEAEARRDVQELAVSRRT